jgi:toxin ParE1/3/4
MSATVIKRAQAQQDLVEQAYPIALDSPAASERFLAATEVAFERLAQMPGLGRLREFKDPDLLGVRSLPVRGFENHLIFYREVEDGIDVIRVLHGARDIRAIFGEEGGG